MDKMQRTSWPVTKGAAVPSDFFPRECEQRPTGKQPGGDGQEHLRAETVRLRTAGACWGGQEARWEHVPTSR